MASEIDPAACQAPRRVWGVMAGQLLRSKTWDGAEHLLYNDLSGDTHLLGAEALDLLRLLQAAEHDEASLAAALTAAAAAAAAEGGGGDTLAPAVVATILADLARLSLVERRAC